jgi:hypothetical protein
MSRKQFGRPSLNRDANLVFALTDRERQRKICQDRQRFNPARHEYPLDTSGTTVRSMIEETWQQLREDTTFLKNCCR